MEGMEQNYDGHVWVKPISTQLSFPTIIIRNKCTCHLICSNEYYPIKAIFGQPNEIAWIGKLSTPIITEGMSSLDFGTLACFHCGNVAVLLRECQCVAYYILFSENKSRLFIHQGDHKHPVAKGVLRASLKKTKTLVERVMAEVPTKGPQHLQFHLAKQMVLGTEACKDGGRLNNVEL